MAQNCPDAKRLMQIFCSAVGDERLVPLLAEESDRRFDGSAQRAQLLLVDQDVERGGGVPQPVESGMIDEPGRLVALLAAEPEFTYVANHHHPPLRVKRQA